MDFEWSAVWEAMPVLWQGTQMTIKITLFGLVGGMALGVLLGVIRAYVPAWPRREALRHRPVSGLLLPVLSWLAQGFILLSRGTPMVVQVMFIYFALPLLANLKIEGEIAATATLIINSGAYIAEIVRGALQSVPKGLYEAGLAMGLPFHKILSRIIAPVAFRRMIPPLGNQCIISLKDSSLFIVIGVAELTRQGQEIMAANFRAVETWGAVAIIYLILTGCIALALKTMEHRMRIA